MPAAMALGQVTPRAPNLQRLPPNSITEEGRVAEPLSRPLRAEGRPAGLSACCPPGRSHSLPLRAPSTSVELKPYTLGAVHPPPYPPGVKLQTSLPAVGRATPWASRATSRQGVLCQGLCSARPAGPGPTPAAVTQRDPPLLRLVLCSVHCQPDPALPRGWLQAPASRAQDPGLCVQEPLPPSSQAPCLRCLHWACLPEPPPPPQTLQLTPCCLPRGEGQTARPDTPLPTCCQSSFSRRTPQASLLHPRHPQPFCTII